MRYGLSDYTLATLENIFSKYPSIKEVILYGSRAMGNYKNGSDIDISLKTDSSFTFDNLLLISRDFDNSDMPYFVDVSIYSKINNKNLLSHIERNGKVLYKSL
ncbi:MAG: nucleotidyltransferase domain-containing protein [Fibromonadaceae bacterium]|jgi:predicted nucleotidyltransferase|nr:nucleotidyltransferase domain-containing protein [Fibromonadaceae bacterium]